MNAARCACLLLLAACAAPQVTPTRNTEPESTTTAIAPADGSNEELARAWEPEPGKPAATPQRPPPEPAVVDRALGFKDALAKGNAALKNKRLDDARGAAELAVKEAATLDGEARAQAGQLFFRVENSAEAALSWRRACGPERTERCRTQALAALASLGKNDKALARELADDETCAAKAERAPKPQPCEPTATRRAEKRDDLWLVQKLALGRALREDDANRQAALLEKAEAKCELPQCAALRRKALTKLLQHARSKSDADAALGYALREIAVINAALPERERRWQRTNTLEQACAAYDKARGVGACRAQEKKTLGYWTFRDWSRDAAGTGLSTEQVRAVNEHFSPLLQECLAEQARRMTPPDAARFDVRWVVFNDGRVGEAHLRRDLDDSLLARCLRAQFSGWRYPRYDGEYQNVEQSFTVTAVERRTLR